LEGYVTTNDTEIQEKLHISNEVAKVIIYQTQL